MFAGPNLQSRVTMRRATGANNAAATIDIAADPENVHVIDWIEFSYSNTPSVSAGSAGVTIKINSVLAWSTVVLLGGSIWIPFPGGLNNDNKNEAVEIKLLVGGVSVSTIIQALTR